VKAKAVNRRQRLRSKKLGNAASVNLLLYLPVGSMTLPSKYKFTVQGADAKPKATAKKKSAKKETPSEAD
tara:strand:- start:60 stop:269 length:210 start_codon:yes stop_codon:yes gene_type:complete